MRALIADDDPVSLTMVKHVLEHAGLDVMTAQDGDDAWDILAFDPDELRARLHAGRHVVALQTRLAERVRELGSAAQRITHLHELLSICCYGKERKNRSRLLGGRRRLHHGSHDQRFSHGICPSCFAQAVTDLERADTNP